VARTTALSATALALLVGGAFVISRLVRLAVNDGLHLAASAAPGTEVGGVIFQAVLMAPLVVWWLWRYRRIVAANPPAPK